MTKFLCDNEGYVIMDFGKSEEKLDDIPEKPRKSKLFKFDKSCIPKELREIADKKTITKEWLLNQDYTDILRLALYNKYTEKTISTLLGVRGIPLRPGFTLDPHQIKTLMWMREREAMNPVDVHGLTGGIVSLKMGLGKTLVALAHLLSSQKGEFPALVIASKTVMREWKSQGVEKFFGNSIKVLYLHKDILGKSLQDVSRADVMECDIVISTYDLCMSTFRKHGYAATVEERGDEHTLMKDKIVAIHARKLDGVDKPHIHGPEILYCTPWSRIVVDESQRFVNPKTATYKAIMALYGRNKWCLSGTPIRNYATDIWAQMRFLGYLSVVTGLEWKRRGSNTYRVHGLDKAVFTMDYKDADVKLPPKYNIIKHVAFSDRELLAYKYILGVTREMYDKMMQGLVAFSCILALFTRLRQCCIAPYLMTAESKRDKKKGKLKQADETALKYLKESESVLGKWVHDKKGTAGIRSSKIQEYLSIIKKLPKNEKFLVFSMFTSCLDLVKDAIEEFLPEVKVLQIDGDVTGNERTDILDTFRSSNEYQGMLLTYKVGSEGLNITEATHVVHCEPWWCPSVEDQGEARCHRRGQTLPVYCYRTIVGGVGISSGSIEEKVLEIAAGKRNMTEEYLEGTSKKLKNGGLDKATLGKILGMF